MNWKAAVKASRTPAPSPSLRRATRSGFINSPGEIFKIDSPQGEPMESANTKRRIGRLDWKPVEEIREAVPTVQGADGDGASVDNRAAVPESAICDLHEGPRGLVAMTGEWCDRLKTILSTAEQLREVNYDDPNLPDLLEQISIEALAMRALL
jgi:hypothetical protein